MVAKLDALEIKVDLQADRIVTLEKELAKANERINLIENDDDSSGDGINRKSTPLIRLQSLQTHYRTCHEFHTGTLRNYKEVGREGAPIKSGYYWIDLDGQGVGEPPVSVYCNMTDGILNFYKDLNLYIIAEFAVIKERRSLGTTP